MSENLYHLLQSSGLVPRELQLNSGEVEWTQEGSNVGNVDMYKGRYLQSEDVRIKVIRSVNMKDEKAVRVSFPGTDSKYPSRDWHAFRELGVKSRCGRNYIKWIKESISYHSMASTPPMAFVCECRQQGRRCPLYYYHISALVSPWMNNGDALAYVKRQDTDVDYRKLVGSFIQFSFSNIQYVITDARNCRRNQSPPLYVYRPWESERGSYLLMALA